MENSLDEIKQTMQLQMGRHVTLRARKGRRGAYEKGGVIDGLYPEVFTVLVREHGFSRRYCFSYSEILTHHVEIMPDPEPLLSLRPET